MGNNLYFVKNGDALLLSSRYATHNITLTNPLASGAGLREIRVERGMGTAHAIITGAFGITGNNGGYRKTGRGLLHWNTTTITTGGGSNRHIGIEGGALRLQTNEKLQLDGGVLGIDTNFTRTIGAGYGRIQWTGHGGFAAYGGTRSVTLNGGAPLTWGQTPDFVAADKELRFGHYTANATVDFQNQVILGPGKSAGESRTIRIERGREPGRADVRFSAGISSKVGLDAANRLALVGDGRIDFSSLLDLEDDKSIVNGGSRLEIRGAELRLNRQSGRIQNVREIQIMNNGTLYLDNRGTHDSETGGEANLDRISDTTKITLAGGTLVNRQSGVAAKDPVEKVGEILVRAGENSIVLSYSDSVQLTGLRAMKLTLGSLSRSVLNIVSDVANPLTLDQSATGFNLNYMGGIGIMPWAPFGDDRWSRAVSSGAYHTIQALESSSYKHGPVNTWAWGDNVRLHSALGSTNQVLTKDTGINSLILYDRNINMNGNVLTIHSGGLLSGGSGTRTITGPSAGGGGHAHHEGEPTLYSH